MCSVAVPQQRKCLSACLNALFHGSVHLHPVCLSQITAQESPGFPFPLLANSSLQLEGLVLVGPVRTLFLSLKLLRHLKMIVLKDFAS